MANSRTAPKQDHDDMTDETAADANAVEAVPDVAHPGSDASPPSGVAPPNAAETPALAAEVADLKDRLLRTLAEMENLRRRTEREVADARSYGISALARDVVGVADNIGRALAAANDAGVSLEGPAKALLDGIVLTERDLLKVLEKNGVRRFEPKGEKFDPHRHQAMFEVPDAEAPAGFIVQVVQAGYMIGERVLRPAMVGVSKGAAKVAPGERIDQGQAQSG
jgi:molecular chaperone GrpE